MPVFNAERAVLRLVASLRAQDYPRDRVEILMVDNNSTDGSAEVLRHLPDVKALSQTDWQTPGATRNVGVEQATGEVLAFIDADCWAHPQWLSRGVSKLVEEKVDRVAGRVEFVFSKRPNIYEIYDAHVNFQQADFTEEGWCGTGNLFVRREFFQEIGLFDPTLRSHEDSEMGLRATRLGKTLGYAADAVVYHRTRTSLWALAKKWIRTEYGAAQVYRRYGLLELHLWTRKANYRPVWGTWRQFPPDITQNVRARWAIDGIANVLRYAGNLGNFLGYGSTRTDHSRAARGPVF